MSLSPDCIKFLNDEYNELEKRRGDEYDRFYGLITATMEYILRLVDWSDSYDDEDIGWDDERKTCYSDLGVEGAYEAECWVMDGWNIHQVLEEVYECDTKEKFYDKFTPNASLAWLYFWDVKCWDEYYPPLLYLRKENQERMDNEWYLPDNLKNYRPLPQWFLEEIKDYDDEGHHKDD